MFVVVVVVVVVVATDFLLPCVPSFVASSYYLWTVVVDRVVVAWIAGGENFLVVETGSGSMTGWTQNASILLEWNRHQELERGKKGVCSMFYACMYECKYVHSEPTMVPNRPLDRGPSHKTIRETTHNNDNECEKKKKDLRSACN